MAGLNKVLIIGRLGKDPETRYTSGGDAVCNFSVATSESWKDKQSGEKKEKTEWHRIVAFRRLGEICGQYLQKGKQVYIEGKLQTRAWEKDGTTRYAVEIVASTMQMLGDKGQPSGGAEGRQDHAPRPKPEQSKSGFTVYQPEDQEDMGDIPF